LLVSRSGALNTARTAPHLQAAARKEIKGNLAIQSMREGAHWI
jgi:hypothetical protein